MKAALLKSPGLVDTKPLEFVDIDRPHAGRDEVLLQVRACGICRTDLHVVEGELPPRLSPVIPGHQVVGEIAAVGEGVRDLAPTQRVGVAWLNRTCGECEFCRAGRENLCAHAEFTGWTKNGGYAEYALAHASFVYSIPEGFDDLAAAPLLCAGIIGYRSLRLTGIRREQWSGARLGIYGFGAAGHVVIQVARSRGAEVYVCTRDRERHQTLAEELGARWVGADADLPPAKLDASIIFAPAGELVPIALRALNKGGVLVLGGIHMSPIPSFDYSLIYGERTVRSVANNTREDGHEFMAEAAAIPVQTHVQQFTLAEANEALIALKHDAIRGAAVLVI